MGAPKQKWTAEEEAALKAGVRKHGAGKWQTILRDPEFSHVLRSRSNVDLKDKWRNINVTASGLGSREKARLALKRNPEAPRHDEKPLSLDLVQDGAKAIESKSPSVSSVADKLKESKRNFTRLESVILDALTALKEPKGSEKDTIAAYIQEQYWEPPNFLKLLSSKLKSMTTSGKLLKVKHRYKISPNLTRTSLDSEKKHISNVEKNGARVFTRPQVDAELEKMRSMPAHEAAAAAAQAVAEAEAAIAEAERAAREAESAEAEAEAAQVFAEAAMKACQKLSVC